MIRDWARSLGTFLLWLAGALFALIIVGATVAPGTAIADLRAWQDLLALLFFISVILGTTLVVADIELGESSKR